MKKGLVITTLGFLAALLCVIVAFNIFAAPAAQFEQARVLALTAAPDVDGDYIVGKKLIEKDTQVVYLVGYFPRLKVTSGGVATVEKMVTVIYNEEIDSYGTTITDMQTGRVLMSKEISEDEASKMMGNILKHIINIGISY
jgi:hypothetical protein